MAVKAGLRRYVPRPTEATSKAKPDERAEQATPPVQPEAGPSAPGAAPPSEGQEWINQVVALVKAHP